MVGCNTAIEGLYIINGTEYVVKAKSVDRNNYGYIYNLVKTEEYSWYNYRYKDIVDFNVGDTIVVTIRKVDD